MNGLSGRTFLVTGGGSGIGRGTCERLSKEGSRVAVLDRDGGRAKTVASRLRQTGIEAIDLACDVTHESALTDAVQRVVAELGPLRGLVTSAGIFDPGDIRPLAEISLETFEGTLRVNLGGTFLAIKCALPALLEAGGGAIVTIASTAALRGHGRGPSYSASKGGVVALTRILAEQYGERGIRVNCICPGAVAGEGMGAYFASEAGGSQAARENPLGRVGLAEELGATAAYLLSEDASFVHGQILAVDGGASVR